MLGALKVMAMPFKLCVPVGKGATLRLFGTSGIRGVVNEDLTPELALRVGMALASLKGGGAYSLARDARTTGHVIAMAFASGVMACGGDVLDLGLLPTGALAFLTRELRARAGCMITASHNPPEYNGLKLFRSDSSPFWPEDEKKLEAIVKEGNFKRSPWDAVGKLTRSDLSRSYIEALASSVELRRSWHVVLDPGCGATSLLAPEVFRQAGCRVDTINAVPDGRFPARSPDLKPDTVVGLCQAVRELGADVGFAYDGDGDRVVVVDEKGRFVPLDVALAAFAAYMVRSRGGGLVVLTVEASCCVEEAVREAGGDVLRTRVGDVSVSVEVSRHKAVFGGEPCGAWVCPQFSLAADGVAASLFLLEALDETSAKPSEFFSGIPRYPVVREKVPCPNELKARVLALLRDRLPSAFGHVRELVKIDGLRLELEDGWVLVRPSGTEPVVRVTAEARKEEQAKAIARRALELVKEALEEAMRRAG